MFSWRLLPPQDDETVEKLLVHQRSRASKQLWLHCAKETARRSCKGESAAIATPSRHQRKQCQLLPKNHLQRNTGHELAHEIGVFNEPSPVRQVHANLQLAQACITLCTSAMKSQSLGAAALLL